MSAQAIEWGTAPPNLTIADIDKPRNAWTYGPFNKDSSTYQDALVCLRMYRKQVTQLDVDQRREIIQIIKEGRFFRTRTAMKSATGHSFYRYARANEFAAEHLSWPKYIIMRALYKDDLPPPYVSHIRQTFGTTAIEDFSHQFFKYFPRNMDGGIAKPIIPTPKVSISDGISAPVSRLSSAQDEADGDEAGAKDNVLPAPKRQKTNSGHKTEQNLDTPTKQTPNATSMDQPAKDTGDGVLATMEEATQQRKLTSAASKITASGVTPPIDLDTRDILDRLPSKTCRKGSKRIDKASWDRMQCLLIEREELAKKSNTRLKALEESHRDVESKLGAMTTAFDAMNATIETIIVEVRADREGYNHVLSSIKDIMRGMADSIKDIKEQL